MKKSLLVLLLMALGALCGCNEEKAAIVGQAGFGVAATSAA